MRSTVTRITEQLQSDMDLMLKLKRAGIQPGREVSLAAVEGGVRVCGADGAGVAEPIDLPAEVASHVFVSKSNQETCSGDRSVTMTRWNESLPGREIVLSQAEIGVIVADRAGNVVFSNDYVAKLLRLDGATVSFTGKPLGELGLLPEGEPGRVDQITRQVLSGISWEDSFAGHRSDGSLLFIREVAVPLRDPSGEIDGIVLVITEAGRRDSLREPDRLRVLERIGQRLAGY